MSDTDRKQTLIILGASGDLTARLLLPGLGSALKQGLADGLLLIGSGTSDWSDEDWQQRVREAFDGAGHDGDVCRAVAERATYVQADATDSEDLASLVGEAEGSPIIYFALSPAITEKVCQALTEVDLPDDTRLVLEKPFGNDQESAAELNDLLATMVPEDRIHRVDHFLGFSTVLNVIGLRFASRLIEPLLNRDHVEEVEIVWDESLGLEGRAGYYDQAGALVDMIQSHLLQVLSILTMEPPSALNPTEVRDGTARVLRATRIWNEDPEGSTRRARYTAGEVDGETLPDYAAEEDVDPDRHTETLAEIVVEVNDWRWRGVPFRLRSGKALGSPRKEAVFTFRPTPRLPDGLKGCDSPDRLRIGLGFGEGHLSLDLNANGPGDPERIDSVTLDTSFGAGDLSEYGEVLKGVLQDDPTFSVRGDAAVECWRIIAPVREAWAEDRVPLDEYEAGSTGPPGWPDGAGAADDRKAAAAEDS